MDTQKGKEDMVRNNPEDSRAAGTTDVACSHRSADWESNTWLISSRSTRTSESMGEITMGPNEGNHVLGTEQLKEALLSDDFPTDAFTKTREVIHTSGEGSEIREQRGHDVTTTMLSSVISKDNACEVLLGQITTNQLATQEYNKAEETEQKIGTGSTLTRPLTSKSASVQNSSSSFKGQIVWDEESKETVVKGKGRTCGGSEDYFLFSDSESTTVSSSRRSSGLSQVEGTAKCLEELVAYAEEELAEQHLHFERLQSFCEVIADEDYEFAPFDCSLEFPTSWNRKVDDVLPYQCCTRAAGSLLKLHKLRACEEPGHAGSSEFLRLPYNGGDLSVAPRHTVVGGGARVLDEEAAAKNVRWLRDSTDKYVQVDGPAPKNGPTPGFTDARDGKTVTVDAAASVFTGLEKIFTLAEGPSCISCGLSMSCSRCYTKMGMLVSCSARTVNHNVSLQSANSGASTGMLHACGTVGDKHSPFAAEEVANREMNGFVVAGGCRGCASNIYCLTCLEHMQEQTAGLHAEGDWRILQAALGSGSSERGSGVEVATLLAVRKAFPHHRFASGQEAEEEVLHVVVRPQRLPGFFQGVCTNSTFTSGEPDTGLACRLDACVDLQDMAEGGRPQTQDSTAVTGRQNGEAWAMCTTCHLLLGTGNVRKVSLSDCEGPHQNASFLALTRGHLHALRVDLRNDIIGMTCSVPVRGVKDHQKTKGEFEKHQYFTSPYPPPYGSKTEVEWGTSQLLQPQQRFRFVETSENDSLRPGFASLNADLAGVEDVSQLWPGTSCTVELKSYRERTERPGGEHGKALYPEQHFSDVLPRKQKRRTCLGRRNETEARSCCGAREVQEWGEGSSGIQCGGTNTCVHMLGRCQDEVSLWKQESKSSGEGNHVKNRSLSVSRIGKQESMCRGAPSATECFSLVPEQRIETVVPAVPVQRGGHVDDQTRVNAAGLRGGWIADTLDVLVTNRKDFFQVPRNEKCTHQLHHLASCKNEMSSTSFTTAKQVGVDTCFSSHSFQCPQDTRPPRGGHRRVGCSTASLRLSPGALHAGRAGEGVDGEAVATAWSVGGPPAVSRTTIGVHKAFSTYRDSGANLDSCGGGGGTPDKLATSCSVKQWRRDSVAHASSVPSSPPGPEKCDREGRTHAAEAGKQALCCETGGATETENWEDSTDTKMKNPAVFCRLPNPIAWNSIAVHSPEQEASDMARDEHWVKNHWQHSRSCQESAKARSPDDAAATRRYSAPARKDSGKSVHSKQIPQPTPVSDPLVVAAYSRTLQEMDPPCHVTLPAFLCSGSTTALTDYPAKVLPLSPNVALQHAASVEPGVVVQSWERGQQRCVSADSEFGRECNACVSEVGRPTGFSLTECTSETFTYCAREGTESSGHPAHVYPNSTHHRQDRDCRVDVDCTPQSAAAGEAKRRRLESPEVRGSPAFTGRQGKQFTCNWSARLSTTTLSIGSTLSTKSGESTYDCSPARAIHHRSRSELSNAGDRGGALKCVQPTAWMWSSLSSREHVDDDGQSTHDDPPLTVNVKCRPASDGRRQPVSLAFAAGEAAERCHSRQCSKIHGSGIFSDPLGTDDCGGILNASDTGTVVRLTDHVAPCVYECPPSSSRDDGAFSRGYEVRQNSGLGGTPKMDGAAAADVAETSQSGNLVGRCASHHNAHKKEMLKRASEHLVSKWINRRDETVVHQHHRTAGVVCRRPLSVKMPGSVPPGALHTEAKPAGPQFPAAVLPPVALQCSSPQPCSTASAGRELPAAVLPPVGTQCSSPQSCSVAPTSSVDAVQEINKKQFTFRAFVKHHATGASGVAEHEEKHRRMENRRKCSARDSSEAARGIPHRTTRQPRYEIKKGVAHGGTILKVGIKPADTDKNLLTAEADDKQELREQTGVQGSEEYFIEGEADISSAATDLLQNRCRIGRTRKPEITRSRVTKTGTHGKSLTFGTSRNIGRSSKGCRTARAAGRKNHLSGRGGITEEGDSLSGTSLSSTSARPTAVDAASRAAVYSGASLSESVTSLAEACRRAFPKKGVQTKAGEARKNDIVCRDLDDNVFTSEKTRRPWRTGADGKILYDACGHKISGVWYDTGRRLWRVVFTQGERRRTKGFSLRQYGFEQARNLAVQCKLAIEAGKSLCEKESS